MHELEIKKADQRKKTEVHHARRDQDSARVGVRSLGRLALLWP